MSFGGGTTIRSEQGRVDDLQSIIGGSEYGANISQIQGSGRVAGNLIWASKPVEHVTTTSETQGGKGGGGGITTETTTYTYTCSFAVLLCAGQVYGVSKMWAGGTLIYDLSAAADAGSISASNTLLANHLTLYAGTETQGQDPTIVSDKGLANTPAYRGHVYAVFRDVNLTPYNNRIPTIQAEVVEYGQLFGGNQITPLKRSVGAILLGLCTRAGIPSANVDVSLLSDEISGIRLAGGTYREVIQHLIDAFAIRPVVSGNKLIFKPSTQTAADFAVTADDLGQGPPGQIGKRVEIKRKRDQGLPRKVTVSFSDPARQGERNTATRRRMTPGASSNDIVIDLPMLLDAASAARIAETTLYRMWTERDTYMVPLGPKNMALDAGDIITIPDGSTTHRIRAKKVQYGYNGQINVEGVAYEPAVSTSTAAGTANGGATPTIPEIGATTMYLLDLPALRDDLAGPGFFFAAAGSAPGWKAASLFVSVDGGVNYAFLARLDQKSTLGATDTALPSPPATAAAWWDNVSSVDVTVLSGTLEGMSDTLVYNGGNSAVIGNEIIQFGAATLIGPKQYRLTHLLRGRRGTEWAMPAHAPGERFVLLGTSVFVPVQLSALNSTRLYKAVPDGLALTAVGETSFTWDGEVLKPFSPVQAKASRAGDGAIALTCIRRSRLGQEMPSAADIPLGETYEQYHIEVLNGAGAVVRLIGVFGSAINVLYTAGYQTLDFGSPQSSVRFRIYQISDSVGRGRVLDVTL